MHIVATKGKAVGKVDSPRGMCESTTTPDKIVVCDWGNKRIHWMEVVHHIAVCWCSLMMTQNHGPSLLVAMVPQTTSSLIGVNNIECCGSAVLMAIPSGLQDQHMEVAHINSSIHLM